MKYNYNLQKVYVVSVATRAESVKEAKELADYIEDEQEADVTVYDWQVTFTDGDEEMEELERWAAEKNETKKQG